MNIGAQSQKLDRVIIRPLGDPLLINALRTGEIDMMRNPPWDDIEDLVADGFKLTTNQNVPVHLVCPSKSQTSILKDLKVRKAMNMAIDREGLVKEVMAGTAKVWNMECYHLELLPMIQISKAMIMIQKERKHFWQRLGIQTVSRSILTRRNMDWVML